MNYEEVSVADAHELQNAGGLIFVCTHGRDTENGEDVAGSRYDLAPIAWCCPLDYAPVSRLLLVCDTGHRTYRDIVASGEFAIAFPTQAQLGLVEQTGSVSGRDVDKYKEFTIKSLSSKKIDTLIPEGVAGWIECRLIKVVEEGTSAIVMGEALFAAAQHDAWRERVHFVKEGLMFAPGKEL